MFTIAQSFPRGWTKGLAANDTSTAFTPGDVAPTITQPTGLIDISEGGFCPKWLKLLLFGAGADTNTFSFRLAGWSLQSDGLWIAAPLIQLTCTLCPMVGVNGKMITSTDLICDTLAIVTGFGTAGQNYILTAPALDIPAYAKVDVLGHTLIKPYFDMTGATNGNFLWAPSD